MNLLGHREKHCLLIPYEFDAMGNSPLKHSAGPDVVQFFQHFQAAWRKCQEKDRWIREFASQFRWILDDFWWILDDFG